MACGDTNAFQCADRHLELETQAHAAKQFQAGIKRVFETSNSSFQDQGMR